MPSKNAIETAIEIYGIQQKINTDNWFAIRDLAALIDKAVEGMRTALLNIEADRPKPKPFIEFEKDPAKVRRECNRLDNTIECHIENAIATLTDWRTDD